MSRRGGCRCHLARDPQGCFDPYCQTNGPDEPTEGHTSRQVTDAIRQIDEVVGEYQTFEALTGHTHRQMDIDECIDLAVREAVEQDQDERNGDDPF